MIVHLIFIQHKHIKMNSVTNMSAIFIVKSLYLMIDHIEINRVILI